MRKKTEREARESALASGWRVEGESDTSEQALGESTTSEHTAASRDLEALVAGDGYGDGADDVEANDEREIPALSNGALVVLGVFGGLYLLYSWGWFIIAQAYSEVSAYAAAGSGSLGSALQQIVFWAAPLAPALWFFVALVLSRGGRTKRLALLLFVGAIVLLPLPMLIARGG